MDYMIIPDKLVLPGIIIGVIFSLIKGIPFFYGSLFAILILGTIIFLIIFFSRGGMGFGDLKLAMMIGAFLGIKYALMTLIISSFLGGIIAIFLLFFRIKRKKDPIPFGPFLSISSIIVLFYGNFISILWGWQ